MRHIRARRRFKLLLTLALALIAMLFAETKIEAFIPQVKNFAGLRIEEAFGGRWKLSIGDLNGGIFHPVILNNVRITDKNGSSMVSAIDIESIKTSFRVWDMLFKIKDKNSSVCINFAARDKSWKGVMRLTGDAKDARMRGVIDAPSMKSIEFSGSLKNNNFDTVLESPSGTIRVVGSLSSENELITDMKIEHLKAGAYDIVCDARSRIVVANNQSDSTGRLQGEFETKNLILNYKPFSDLKILYKIEGGVLKIDEARIGDAFQLCGKVLLRYPHTMDMVLKANNVSLSWLFLNLGVPDAASVLSGTMNGKFEFKGPVSDLKLNARMEIRKGTLSTLDFEALHATLKGDLPYVRIEDSRVTRESGYFTLAGEMDLRRIGKNTLFDSIVLTSNDKAITWDEWNAAKAKDFQEVRMKKRLSDNLNIDFKKYIAEEKIDESMKDKDEVGLEYKLHPHDSLKMSVGQNSKFLGLEHKDKF